MAQAPLTEEVLNKIRTLQAEIDQIQASLGTIEQQLAILGNAIESLQDAINIHDVLKTKVSGDEILIPIGGACYIRCRIEDPNEIFLSLGSGVSMETDLQIAKTRTLNQMENIQKSSVQLQNQYSQFSQLLETKRENLVTLAQQYGIIQ
ncbi:prefoldin subunit alpha [Candidatus Hodarchaeum mangrovi]